MNLQLAGSWGCLKYGPIRLRFGCWCGCCTGPGCCSSALVFDSPPILDSPVACEGGVGVGGGGGGGGGLAAAFLLFNMAGAGRGSNGRLRFRIDTRCIQRFTSLCRLIKAE